jgi:hypothetical protein
MDTRWLRQSHVWQHFGFLWGLFVFLHGLLCLQHGVHQTKALKGGAVAHGRACGTHTDGCAIATYACPGFTGTPVEDVLCGKQIMQATGNGCYNGDTLIPGSRLNSGIPVEDVLCGEHGQDGEDLI